MPGRRGFLRRHFLILLVLLAAAGVRLAVISRPFIANEEGTAGGIPLCVARNFARYGPLASRFAGVLNTGRVPRSEWMIYSHHPPGMPLLVAAVMRVGGVNEFTSRLTAACFALANALLLYALGRRYFNPTVGILAAVFYSFCPETLAFGDMPDFVNVQVVFFMLACIGFYARWRENRRRLDFLGVVVCVILGVLTDWPMFYLVPLLGLHYLITDGWRGIIRFIPFALLAVGLFGLLGWWMTWSGGDVSIFHQLGVRTLGELNDRVPITFGVWMRLIFHRDLGVLHSYPVLLLSILYIGVCLARVLGRDWNWFAPHLVPLMLLGIVAIHATVAIQGNLQHQFWSVIFTPGLCLAAAIACDWLMVRWFVAVPILLAFFVISIPEAQRLWWSKYPYLRDAPYSQKQLGSVIHQIAREDQGVMTSDPNMESALWFYADRQLIPAVTTPRLFERAMAHPYYMLPFSYAQRSGPKPRWFVMPVHDRASCQPLSAMLDAKFPRTRVDAFDVYDLTAQHDAH